MNKSAGYISLFLILALMLSLCACGGRTKPEEQEDTKLPSEGENISLSFMASAVSKPHGARWIKAMSISDGMIYVVGADSKEEYIYSSPLEDISWEKVKINLKPSSDEKPHEQESEISTQFQNIPMEIRAFSVAGDRMYIIGGRWTEHGDEYYKYIFNKDGNLESVDRLENIEGLYVERWEIASDYLIACAGEESLIFSAGEAAPLCRLDRQILFTADIKGELYAAVSGEGENELCRFNAETGELQKICAFPAQEFMTYSSYLSEKELYISDEESLMQVDVKSGETKEILNWNEAGAGIVSAPEGLHIMENGDIYLMDSWANIIYKVAAYEGAPRKVLNIAYAGSGGVYENAARAKFNSENQEYVIKSISCDWEHPEKLLTQISAGDAPDLLYMGNSTDREMDNPFLRIDVDDSLCVDLMPYLEKEPELMAGFVPGLLDKLCTDGKLYKMPADFSVWSVAAPKELADKYEKWDMDALLDVYENLPEGYTLFSGSRSEFMRYFSHYCSIRFVDMAKGSCNFEDPDFAVWLELLKELKFPEGDEKSLLDFTLIHAGLPRFCRERYGDYEYVGVPGSEGGVSFLTGSMGGYSIMAGSENKDAAWEYIKIMLSYELQDALYAFGLQVMNENLQEKLDRASEYTEFTEEDREKFEALLESSEGMAFGGMLEQIITEEAQKYFADRQNLEDTIKMIQSRAGIYLAERK